MECCKLLWKNCPSGRRGQLVGKEGDPVPKSISSGGPHPHPEDIFDELRSIESDGVATAGLKFVPIPKTLVFGDRNRGIPIAIRYPVSVMRQMCRFEYPNSPSEPKNYDSGRMSRVTFDSNIRTYTCKR